LSCYPSYESLPYSEFEIESLVEEEKHTLNWEEISFHAYGGSKQLLESDTRLVVADGRYARFRFVVKAPIVDIPLSYSASLLLENSKIRGVDYHELARRRLYGREAIPKGWHEDIRNPNLDDPYNSKQKRKALPDFAPYDLNDFSAKVAKMWNIVLPEENKYLL